MVLCLHMIRFPNVLFLLSRYPHPIAQDIALNPEFPPKAAVARQSSLVNSQLFMLKNAVGHLRNAYNGLDVEWTDVGKLAIVLIIIYFHFIIYDFRF